MSYISPVPTWTVREAFRPASACGLTLAYGVPMPAVSHQRHPEAAPAALSNEHIMIDNFTAKLGAPIHHNLMEELTRGNLPDWTLMSDGRKRVAWQMEKHTVLVHVATGLRASLNDGYLTRIEVLFPRLLPLRPEYQCRYESDMAFRWENMYDILDTLAPRMRDRALTITRVDLALTMHLDPRRILALHRNARHPMIRRETELYYNDRPGRQRRGQVPYHMDTLNSVVFNGTETRITLYDKVAQVCKHRSEVPEPRTGLRVEVQLKHAKRIGRAFGKQKGATITVADLTLANCYSVYRDILTRFDSIGGMTVTNYNLAVFLAIAERNPGCWADFGGMRPLEAYRLTNKLSDERYRQLRRDVNQVAFQHEDFRWSEVLPVDCLPETTDIGECGQVVQYGSVPLSQ